ncbi:MAG: CinA family protein, partial [Candidatus Neomarinimicrobiota bacterium]|nr:CinA family protein [Candidatus Neomarinimicrobiota bacterium]
EKSKMIATAESCTGGLISHRLTEVPGSSSVYLGGMVVYSNDAKINLLGVENSIIQKHGAVSKETAAAMAVNVSKKFSADYGISITGLAGPTGGSPDKPIGLVYIGLANGENLAVKKFRFGENRKRNKLRISQAGLDWLRKSLLHD